MIEANRRSAYASERVFIWFEIRESVNVMALVIIQVSFRRAVLTRVSRDSVMVDLSITAISEGTVILLQDPILSMFVVPIPDASGRRATVTRLGIAARFRLAAGLIAVTVFIPMVLRFLRVYDVRARVARCIVGYNEPLDLVSCALRIGVDLLPSQGLFKYLNQHAPYGIVNVFCERAFVFAS